MSALDYGWKGEDRSAESFWIRFNSCTRETQTWKEELYAAARAVASRTTKPLWVCSSGGIDSEIACRVFFEQGIPFSVLTLEHKGGTNSHDIHYAIKWCTARGVPQKIVTIDMTEFLTTGIDAYAEHYVAIHPFRYLQLRLMEIVEEMGGYAILCSGEQLYDVDRTKPVITPRDLYLPLSNGTVMPLEWCKEKKTSHEPYFHFSTPELCLAYIRMPLIAFVLNNPEAAFRHKANIYTLKRVAYQSVWTDLEVRYKADGFENVKPLFDAARDRLRLRYESEYIRVDLPLPLLESQLTGMIRE